ncbi:MAG: 3-deoxy-D-manno-octulosonic acid transferase [Rhodospirillales bacterium]|nr:3-deoxy-D-manno-octulosonic acid transferase [Rhodospirillales bacterium]
MTAFITLYSALLRLAGGPFLRSLLASRAEKGKENPARIGERMGRPTHPRPPGPLVWIHGASVGEAQSALILIEKILEKNQTCPVLVTTGTLTSAALMATRLPHGAIHQFYPLDHPEWVDAFLDHWRPDAVLWMESELWPCMLSALSARKIPAALVNGRLSPRSARRWKAFPKTARQLLGAFSVCLAQSESDARAFLALSAQNVSAPGNLKFSAAPLPCDPKSLETLRETTTGRPCWLYASTHAGEEDLACRIHLALREKVPGLLTILVPRHPERGDEILHITRRHGLKARLRGPDGALPDPRDDFYIADTLGELGLFYRLAPVACVGRSFSLDGGGGHNPIEAARLGCAVLHGPAVQNLTQIYTLMDESGAALSLHDEAGFIKTLESLLTSPNTLSALQDKARSFAQDQDGVIERVMNALEPVLAPAFNPAPSERKIRA